MQGVFDKGKTNFSAILLDCLQSVNFKFFVYSVKYMEYYLFTIVVTIATLFLGICLIIRSRWKLTHIPGPSLIACALHFNNVHPFILKEAMKRKAKIMRFNLFGAEQLIIAHPDSLKFVFANPDVFVKLDHVGDISPSIHALVSPNVGSVNGLEWDWHRKVVAKGFEWTTAQYFLPVVVEKTQHLLEKWSRIDQQGFDCWPWVKRYALDLVALTTLSFDFEAVENENSRYYNALETILEVAFSIMYQVFGRFEFLPLPVFRHVRAASKLLRDLCLRIIAEKKAGKKSTLFAHGDMVDNFIEAGMTDDQELIGNIHGGIVGGQPVTILLGWVMYCVATQSTVQEKCIQEVDRVLKNQPPQSVNDIAKLRYMNMVIKEILRMYPPVGQIPSRTTTRDCEFEGIKIPKGTWVVNSHYTVHHRNDVWDDPETFKPERFANDAEEKYIDELVWPITPPQQQTDFFYVPFARVRSCPAKQFSFMQAKTLLAMVLQRYKLSFVSFRMDSHPAFVRPSSVVIKLTEREK
jgi:cytochrome P450